MCTKQNTLWCIFSENDESLEVILSDDAASDLENSPKFVEIEDLESLPKRQFKTAEIADAVMGTEAPIDPSDIKSLFPRNVKDYLSSFSPPCVENSAELNDLVAKGAILEDNSPETSQQVSDQNHDDQEMWEQLTGNYIIKTDVWYM